MDVEGSSTSVLVYRCYSSWVYILCIYKHSISRHSELWIAFSRMYIAMHEVHISYIWLCDFALGCQTYCIYLVTLIIACNSSNLYTMQWLNRKPHNPPHWTLEQIYYTILYYTVIKNETEKERVIIYYHYSFCASCQSVWLFASILFTVLLSDHFSDLAQEADAPRLPAVVGLQQTSKV